MVLITYQDHLARSTAWISPWGACNGRRIGPNGLHDAMSVARIRFPCRCGAWNMRFVRNQDNGCEDGLQGRTSNCSSGPLVRDGPERLPEWRGRHIPSRCARFPGRVRAVPDGHDVGTRKTGRTAMASNSASHSSEVDAARTAYQASHPMSEEDRTRTGA